MDRKPGTPPVAVSRVGWRVARAFDLARITNTVGGPFLRVLCEGAGVGNAGAQWV
jgi:hypothetical protein